MPSPNDTPPAIPTTHHEYCDFRQSVVEGAPHRPCDCWLDDSDPEPRPTAPIAEGYVMVPREEYESLRVHWLAAPAERTAPEGAATSR